MHILSCVRKSLEADRLEASLDYIFPLCFVSESMNPDRILESRGVTLRIESVSSVFGMLRESPKVLCFQAFQTIEDIFQEPQ